MILSTHDYFFLERCQTEVQHTSNGRVIGTLKTRSECSEHASMQFNSSQDVEGMICKLQLLRDRMKAAEEGSGQIENPERPATSGVG